MPKLIVENGPDKGREFSLSPDEPAFAGRDPGAQVPLRDEMISRRHFKISRRVNGKESGYFIEDLSSSNGTLLNGSILKGESRLSANDRVEIGETRLTFVDEKPHPLLGKEIAGYRILDRIGRGGMGTVYRALQTSLDRTVALKILAPHLVKNSSFINLFIREARAAGALSHPNIVQVYDVGVEDGVYFFSMEYIPDGSVEDVLNQEKKIPLGRALRVVRDATLGLQYAESKGIIHRDIKPGNLMVGSGQVVKIGDLGIARSTGGEASVSQKDGVSGSPHYIAPEQAQGKDIDHRVDLYSLGISFYQMLCSKTPFSGSTPREVILKHIKEEPQPISERVPGLPDEVARLIHRMIAKDPANRVESATKLLELLEPLLERYPADGTEEPQGGPNWRRAASMLIVGAVLAVVGGSAAYLYKDIRQQAVDEKNQLDAWRLDLDKIEEHLDAEQLTEARTLLDAFAPRGDVPSELVERKSELADRLRAGLEKQREIARVIEAGSALLELQEGFPAQPGTAEIDALRKLARDFSDTPTSDEAETLARSIEKEMEERADFIRDANTHLEERLSAADVYTGLGKFARARAELLAFDERYRDTLAQSELDEALVQLETLTRSRWQEIRNEIRQHIEDKRLVEALDAAQRFRAEVGFPKIVEAVDAEIAKIESARAATSKPEVSLEDRSHKALASALLAAWNEIKTDFQVNRALLRIEGRRLDLLLTPEAIAQRDSHREFILGIPEGIKSLAQQDAPPGAEKLEITTRSHDRTTEKTVELTGLTESRLNYKEYGDRGRSTRSFSKWNELSESSRAKVLLFWARTPEEKLLAGFLAAINGNVDDGLAAMSEAVQEDPELASERDGLRDLIQLVAEHAVED